MKKVALVVQRYGEDLVGGAELHARKVAEHLVADLGWQVTVFTTTAKDYHTWEPFYRQGHEMINGVSVERFHTSALRNMTLFRGMNFLLLPILKILRSYKSLSALNRSLESLWLDLQGPQVPRLLDTLMARSAEFHKIIFFTYLYAPTQRGAVLFKNKAILVPTAHDEAAFYFAHTKSLLNSVSSILTNTEAEKRLLLKVAPETSAKISVVGMGIDDKQLIETRPERRGTEPFSQDAQRPYMLYLGRIGRAKGIDQLITYFDLYRQQTGGVVDLVLAGGVDSDYVVPTKPGVRSLGFVSDEGKARLLQNAACIVNPSPLESLSLLSLEAMALKKPLLLNERCDVFADYVACLPSVVGFHDYESFRRGAEACLKGMELNALEETFQWVMKQYSWLRVMESYQRASDA